MVSGLTQSHTAEWVIFYAAPNGNDTKERTAIRTRKQKTMKPDPTTRVAIMRYTGPLTKCPAGFARAGELKKPERVEFRCPSCGLPGSIRFARLRSCRPINLRCRHCGRKLS
jgi:hypothetical protein